MAKIGYLYLRRGRWRGKQIVPESFVSLATRQAAGLDELPVEDGLLWSAAASGHYGLLWWNNNDGAIEGVPRDAFWSWGLKESFIIVIPSLDLVAVRAGDYWAPRNDPQRKDPYNNIVKPFLLPICESVRRRGTAGVVLRTWYARRVWECLAPAHLSDPDQSWDTVGLRIQFVCPTRAGQLSFLGERSH